MPYRPNCPFCNYDGPSDLKYEGRHTYIIEPMSPVVDGHLLVIPYAHVNDFADNPTVAGWVMKTASWWANRKGGAWNLITSKGTAATQTVRHLHVHLIPRHRNDGLALPWSKGF